MCVCVCVCVCMVGFVFVVFEGRAVGMAEEFF